MTKPKRLSEAQRDGLRENIIHGLRMRGWPKAMAEAEADLRLAFRDEFMKEIPNDQS